MSKKGNARIERDLAKKLKNEEKKVRLLEKLASDTPEQKTIRLGANPDSIFKMTMAWHVESADKDGAWSWGVSRDWGEETWTADIEPKLNEYAQLTWQEIDAFTTSTGHKSHHGQAVDSICAEAQTRIADLQIAHDGDIFRFRLARMKRLWGFRDVNVFSVLWYDPTHQIYETEPP